MVNKEQKIHADLKDMLDKEEYEYVLYGKLAPKMKRIGIIIGMWLTVAILLLVKVLPVGLYLVVLITIMLVLSYLFFYQIVYLAKFGKHLYIHEFDYLKLSNYKDKIMLRNGIVVKDRTSDLHLTLKVQFNGQDQFLIFKRNSENRGYPNQSTNMRKLTLDINKKHKK